MPRDRSARKSKVDKVQTKTKKAGSLPKKAKAATTLRSNRKRY